MTQASDARPSTLRDLFCAHGRFVAHTLLRLGVRDADVDDGVQEVFIVAARKLSEYQERGAPRSWLWAICLNVSRTSRRKRTEELGSSALDNATQHTGLTEERLDHRRALRAAQNALDQLSDELREVFILYEVQGLPMREIAEAMGCPLQTAYWRLHTARDRLRAVVIEKGGLA